MSSRLAKQVVGISLYCLREAVDGYLGVLVCEDVGFSVRVCREVDCSVLGGFDADVGYALSVCVVGAAVPSLVESMWKGAVMDV